MLFLSAIVAFYMARNTSFVIELRYTNALVHAEAYRIVDKQKNNNTIPFKQFYYIERHDPPTGIWFLSKIEKSLRTEMKTANRTTHNKIWFRSVACSSSIFRIVA